MSATTTRRSPPPSPPQSLVACLRYFLTPQLCKQAHATLSNYQAPRWGAQPLLLVLLVTTWCAGDALGERFETARAFYVAS